MEWALHQVSCHLGWSCVLHGSVPADALGILKHRSALSHPAHSGPFDVGRKWGGIAREIWPQRRILPRSRRNGSRVELTRVRRNTEKHLRPSRRSCFRGGTLSIKAADSVNEFTAVRLYQSKLEMQLVNPQLAHSRVGVALSCCAQVA